MAGQCYLSRLTNLTAFRVQVGNLTLALIFFFNQAMITIGESILTDSISIDETEYDFTNEVETNADLRLGRGNPCLSDLATKHPKVLKKKSYLYLYNVLTVAVFYGLPVVQLVIAYQRVRCSKRNINKYLLFGDLTQFIKHFWVTAQYLRTLIIRNK